MFRGLTTKNYFNITQIYNELERLQKKNLKNLHATLRNNYQVFLLLQFRRDW